MIKTISGTKQINPTADIHFYKNKVTGEVYYDMDYKVKFDTSLNPHMDAKKFFESLPRDWRPEL